MAIFDQPLEARLRAYESANRYDRPRNALHLVLICCRRPIGANSILTLELISGIQLAQDLPNGESSSAVIHPSATTSVPTPCLLPRNHHDDTHGLPKQGLGKLPQTQRSIVLRSATCLSPPAHSLFPPSPHRHWRPDCKSLGLRTLAAPVHPREAHSLFPFLQSNHAGYSLRRDDSQVHDNELPGRLWSRLSILSFLHSGSFNNTRIALELPTRDGISFEKGIRGYQKAEPIPYRLHKTRENSPVSRYFPLAEHRYQHALRALGCDPNPRVQLAVCGCHRCGDPDVGIIEPRREALIPIRTGDELDNRW